MCLYYCLKYYCAQFVSVYELSSKWSFICFNQCSLKVSLESITNLDPHVYHWKQRYDTVSLNHCAFMKRKLCRYWKHIAGVLTPMLPCVCTVRVCSAKCNRLKLTAMFILYFSSKKAAMTLWEVSEYCTSVYSHCHITTKAWTLW